MNKVEMNRCFAGAQKPPAAGRGVVALLLLFSALSAGAVTDTATGLVYEEASGEVTITDHVGPSRHIVIPATLGGLPVVAIMDRAFFADDLISITIPDSVRSIGDLAFPSCISLESVDLGDGLQSIGRQAFDFCTALTSITIPDSVRSIDDLAFVFCTALTSITIPGNVQSIGRETFSGCAALETVELGDSVQSIGNQAFLSCTALTSITIPDNIQSIGREAFENCTALETVEIGAGVTNIGRRAFRNCGALEAVYFKGDAPSLGVQVFSLSPSVTIYYLSGTSGWGSMFGGRPTALDDRATRPPQIFDAGVRSGGRFGFKVQWTDGREAVVEASDDLPGGVWSPVSTNTIPAVGSISFEEATVPESRFYRVRSK